MLHLAYSMYGAETWTLRKGDQKYLQRFEMWCWRRIEKIIWTDYMKNEEVLPRVKKERNILHTVKRRKANCIGHILRRKSSKTRYWKKIEKIICDRRQGRRRKQLLHDLTERTWYCKLKEKAQYRTLLRTCFRRGYGPVIRQTSELIN